MSFDPDSVERFGFEDGCAGDLVRASDYDSLLALYREAVPLRPPYCMCGHHRDGHINNCGSCTTKTQGEKPHHMYEWTDCECKSYRPDLTKGAHEPEVER